MKTSAARLAPGEVATALATRASLYKGKTYQPPGNARPRQTKEGVSAVKDAIQWLQKCEAASPLTEAGVGLKLAATLRPTRRSSSDRLRSG